MRLKFIAGNSFSTLCSSLTVILTVVLMGLQPSAAWATAAEEPSSSSQVTSAPKNTAPITEVAIMSEPQGPAEPVQISELPTSPYIAGQVSGLSQRKAATVINYIQNYNRKISSDEAGFLSQAIVNYSERYGVDYRLLTSLIAIESAFRRDAISSSGAIGMGQLKPKTARWLGVVDPYNPEDNIAGTARYLSWLVKRYNGNLEYALSAYYQGQGFVDRNGVAPVCMPYLVKVNRALGALL